MAGASSGKVLVIGLSAAVAITMLAAIVLSGALLAAPASSPSSSLKLDSGATQQWAFGGNASAAVSCTGSACGAGSEITSLSIRYYVGWVVIYTATNISSSQTEYEVQAAVNASLVASVNGCVNETSGPCSTISANANLAGRETAAGFSNITNTGTVNLNGGPGTIGNVAALALMNAESRAAFNFSGSYSLSETNSTGTYADNVNFDLGGNELSTVNFPTPLGIVPIDPQPGDTWNSSAPYTATGAYTSGYSLSEDIDGHSASTGDWANLSMSPSGTLQVNGTDLGAYTLWDNWTNPATSVSGQLIVLNFSNGEFTGTDGWLMVPSGLYSGALGGLGGVTLLAGQQPAQSVAASGTESTYYKQGSGFIGVQQGFSAADLGTSGGPSANLNAGPEPVSVAQSQYSAITSPSGAAAAAFPYGLVVIGVVVVVVVVVAVLVVVRRPGRRRPGADLPPPYPTGAYSGWVPPEGPPSAPGIQPPPPPPMGPGGPQ